MDKNVRTGINAYVVDRASEGNFARGYEHGHRAPVFSWHSAKLVVCIVVRICHAKIHKSINCYTGSWLALIILDLITETDHAHFNFPRPLQPPGPCNHRAPATTGPRFDAPLVGPGCRPRVSKLRPAKPFCQFEKLRITTYAVTITVHKQSGPQLLCNSLWDYLTKTFGDP